MRGAPARRRGAPRHLGVSRQLPIRQGRPGRLALLEGAPALIVGRRAALKGERESRQEGVLPPPGSRRGSSSSPRRQLPPGNSWGSTVPSARPRVARTTSGVVSPARAGRAPQVGSFHGGSESGYGVSWEPLAHGGAQRLRRALALSGGCPGARRRSYAARASRLRGPCRGHATAGKADRRRICSRRRKCCVATTFGGRTVYLPRTNAPAGTCSPTSTSNPGQPVGDAQWL